MMNVQSTGPGWAKARKRLKTAPSRLRRAVNVAVLRYAHWLRARMAQGLLSGSPGGKAFKPHSPWTMVARMAASFAGSKILIRSGTMLGSIQVHSISGGAFIGIKRGTTRGKYRIAELHEKGAVARQPWTSKQRRWWFAQLQKAGYSGAINAAGGSHTVRIPARPFISPILKQDAQPAMVLRRITAVVARELGGDFGTP